uniref:DM10 domain-containing protein n=1 Tax=Ascaris lumbricoides TaxID=6252 RepID=A0A0M3HPU9_ASCLU
MRVHARTMTCPMQDAKRAFTQGDSIFVHDRFLVMDDESAQLVMQDDFALFANFPVYESSTIIAYIDASCGSMLR